MESPQQPKATFPKILVILLVVMVGAAGVFGYILGYWSVSRNLKELQSQVTSLSDQLDKLQRAWQSSLNRTAEQNQTIIYQNTTIYQNNTIYQNTTTYVPYILGENVSLSELYEKVKDSVVVIRGVAMYYDIFRRPYYTLVQGSGFTYNYSGQMVIITNYHVVANTVNVTVTFSGGNSYIARIIGSDSYADLAVLSADAPQEEFKPLEIVSSSTLKVGDMVVAVGNPYGLAGSTSVGIVSALGRTITEDLTGGYPIANLIQTTAPLNPGNSGGPLLNLKGQVVGITTAIVADSQGLGFAVPSNTILREIADLVTKGSYNRHPWLGANGVDMTYEIAKAMGVNITYGWLIVQVFDGGPAAKAGLRSGNTQVVIAGQSIIIGGDIIIAINGAKITGIDSLSSYLEEYTAPGQTINVTAVRGNDIITVPMTLEARP